MKLRVLVSTQSNQPVNVSTLSDDQRRALLSDIETQLQSNRDIPADARDEVRIVHEAGQGGFTIRTDVPERFVRVALDDLEDYSNVFGGAAHKATIVDVSKSKTKKGGKRRRRRTHRRRR